VAADRAQLLERAEAWLAADPDADTRAEVQDLLDAGDVDGLAQRFDGRLQFGTAGLRGPLGAGPRRMNRLLVRQAAAGLAAWVGPGARVVVGFDARHKSAVFADDSARVLAAAGCVVARLPKPLPTPLLAFAVRHLDAGAGVMVTASHNPARDNGYKVYVSDGAQIVPPIDHEIADAIDAVPDPLDVPLVPLDHPSIEQLGDEIERAYVDLAASEAVADSGPRDVRVVYTPMHGVGGRTALDAFDRTGFGPPELVAEQFEPDPDFPTVAFPNPEEPGALDHAFAVARRTSADVVLAHDPDADRLGVGILDGGEWRRLTGNEVGFLLADHVLAATEGDDRLVVTTIVSSPMLARMAEAAGVHHAETLTGFKWVVRPGLTHPELRFVFGYEEALGYSVVEYVRDKDGITAGLAFAELVARLKVDGRTVLDRLFELSREYGYHGSLQWSARDDTPGGLERLRGLMERLRRDPPSELAGQRVDRVHDYLPGDATLAPMDALRLDLGAARVVVRPSGTEPKLKCYFDLARPLVDGPEPYAATRRAATDDLERLRVATADRLGIG
jgi:phosphomannomutase